MNTAPKKLALAINQVLLMMAVGSGSVYAKLSTTIPAGALTNGGTKVNICHFPTSDLNNVQHTNIYVSALNNYLTYPDDTFDIGGRCTWLYHGGYSAYDSSTGKPKTLLDKKNDLPDKLLNLVQTRLPEGQGIGSNPAALAQLTDDAGANVFLKEPANVKVSFITEMAGYENSVGFFKFSKATLTTLAKASVVDKIIFPNFSDDKLAYGKTVDLGNFVAGDALGFTIVSNGWQTVVGNTANRTGMVDANKSSSRIFRTIKRFNPETTVGNNLQAHTILFAYPEQHLMVLAFEDLNRESPLNNDFGYTSDNDFNDVIMAIHVEPWSAVDCTNCDMLVTPTPTPTPTPAPAPAPVVSGQSGPISWRDITSSADVSATPTGTTGGNTVP